MATTDDILDLRRRVEALEARAAAEESSAPDVDSALLRTGMVTARHLATIKESLTVEPAQQRPIDPRIGVLNASIKASMDRIQALVADLPEPPLPPADRPKLPSLKEQALAALKRQSTRSIPSLVASQDCDTIRRALEALSDE